MKQAEGNREDEVTPLNSSGADGGGNRAHDADEMIRVLVVDDERANAFAMQRLLTLMGHQACGESCAQVALQKLATFKPHIILSDVMMPGMTGIDFARRVRAAKLLPQVLLVALTGSAEPDDREAAMQAGFDDYYVKPVGIEELRRIIQMHEVRRS